MLISISNIIISTVLLGFLEFGFVSLLSIRILGAFESLSISKKKAALAIILPAIFTNLPAILGVGDYMGIVVGSLICSVLCLIILIYLITRKSIIHVVLSVIASLLTFVVTEYMFGLPIQMAAHMTPEMIANNPILAFLGSLPERIIQYILLYVVSVNGIKKIFAHGHQNVDIITIIETSRTHKRNAIIILLMVLTYTLTFILLFAVKGVLSGISTISAIFVSMLVLCAPFIVLLIFVESIYKSHENHRNFTNYIVNNARSKAIEVYIRAIKINDKETMDAAAELLASLDLTE